MADSSPTLNDHSSLSSGHAHNEPEKTNRNTEERLTHNEGVATSLYELCLLTVRTIIGLQDAVLRQEQMDCLNVIATDLRLWGGLTKTSKFEQCLASCTDIQHDVLSLLRGTGRCLQRLITFHQTKIPEELLKQLWAGLLILIEKTEVVLNEAADDDAATTASEDNEDCNDDLSPERITEMLDDISSNVELLMELTPTLERTYGVMKLPPKPISFSISNEALPYVNQVWDRFPKATLELIGRLGEANWQRFCRIRLPHNETPSVIRSTFKPASTFHDSGVGSSLCITLSGSRRPVDYISSNESLASSAQSDHMHRSRVPPEPSEVAEGEPFTCQFCNQTQHNIRNRNDWKFHVFQDLQPYICTYEDCSQMLSTFPTRKAWAQHEIEFHLQTIGYRCFTCGMTLSVESELNRHHEEHIETSKDKQMIGLQFALKIEYVDWNSVKCQLCHYQNFATSRDYTSHVAKHMEKVALVVIPQDEDSDLDSDSDSGSEPLLYLSTRRTKDESDQEEKTRHKMDPVHPSSASNKEHIQDLADPNRPPSEPGRTSSSSRRVQNPSAPDRENILDLADPSRPSSEPGTTSSTSLHAATFQCTLCPKRFTRAYNLRSHLRTHTDVRPFVCTVCGKAFARQHDRKRHEGLHSGEKKFICRGELSVSPGHTWGCGRRFARADALGRHFRTEAGRACIKSLLDEEAAKRAQKATVELQNSSNAPATFEPPPALLAQYPALQNLDWDAIERDPYEVQNIDTYRLTTEVNYDPDISS